MVSGSLLVSHPVVTVSSLTFVVWDILITLDDEVNYIWSQGWRSPTKWLFLFTRYFSLGSQLVMSLRSMGGLGRFPQGSEGVCRGWFFFQLLTVQILISTVESILTLRVYALYRCIRPIRILLTSVFTVQLLIIAPAIAFMTPKIRFDTYCIPIPSTNALANLHLITAASLLMQLVLFVLTLVKSINTIREPKGRIPILVIIARDSLWVFCLVTVMLMVNGVFYTILSETVKAFVYTWILSGLSFSSCRLVLNLFRLNETAGETGIEDALTSHFARGTELQELSVINAGNPEVRSSVTKAVSRGSL
ncbi:hypothetical protein JAAARDRAFT_39965 [Jaapia argillacea MUCL 33604]|uniref:DUF6533 domain-containing protein n=1 Tax=Jaapia argillacea MUCL 33604 TaxID=933084 RepID=A0A067PQU5_9AGAM|nr:hypothetical protein JAAARDRAFT_39965 [Jaapia argillacea MUCL 33604]